MLELKKIKKKRVDIKLKGGKDYKDVDEERAKLDHELLDQTELAPEDRIDILNPE